jgi:hypothetical protein
MRLPSVYTKAECGLCGRLFFCHPVKVPTVTALGETRKVCQACMEMANRRRAERQLPLLRIPPGAYEPEPS